jgi:hypothetical protein
VRGGCSRDPAGVAEWGGGPTRGPYYCSTPHPCKSQPIRVQFGTRSGAVRRCLEGDMAGYYTVPDRKNMYVALWVTATRCRCNCTFLSHAPFPSSGLHAVQLPRQRIPRRRTDHPSQICPRACSVPAQSAEVHAATLPALHALFLLQGHRAVCRERVGSMPILPV